MESETTEELTVERKLNEIFDEAKNLFDEIENSTLSFNSSEFQLKVKKSIENFEDATRLVSLGGIFSTNEFFEEIPTEHLQYLLLPFYLGQLSTKLLKNNREEILKIAQIYYKDFIKRCEDYEIIERNQAEDGNKTTRAGGDDELRELVLAASQRNNKLEYYRKQKELQQQIENLKLSAKSGQTDHEAKRDLYLKTINYSILKVKEELDSIEQELKILEYRKGMSSNSGSERNDGSPKKPPRRHDYKNTPLTPIIITKDVAQKAVFGMGYPSLPIMTVAEFYEQRVRDGIFPNAEKVKEINAQMLARQQGLTNDDDQDKEEEEKTAQEILEEEDDEENLARLRAKDEYKDIVRRGDGNRHNRS